jgi:hypothetical protein
MHYHEIGYQEYTIEEDRKSNKQEIKIKQGRNCKKPNKKIKIKQETARNLTKRLKSNKKLQET